jgi:hypothetical protein
VIVTAAGEEAQVDYGSGPMVRDPLSGKYRRTRLFVMTLGNSRKAVRLLVFRSSTRTWAELHEKAFRRLGGATKIVILDNLREGGRGCCGSTDSGIVALRRSWSEIFLRKRDQTQKRRTLRPTGQLATYTQRVLQPRRLGPGSSPRARPRRESASRYLCPCTAVKQQGKNKCCPR